MWFYIIANIKKIFNIYTQKPLELLTLPLFHSIITQLRAMRYK